MRLIILFSLLLSATLALANPEKLTVYTYRSFTSQWGPGPVIKTQFEKECQCEINFVTLDDSAGMISRLKMEGDKTKADVVLGVDYNQSVDLVAQNMVAPHGIKLTDLSVPEGWDDLNFVPFDYSYIAFIYNSKKISDIPHTIRDFAANKKIKVIYEDPRTSSLGLDLILWWSQIYTDLAPSLWKQLSAQTVTVTKGWSEAYGLFLKNESDVVLSYITSPAYHSFKDKSDDFQPILFDEGQFLQIETAAMLKNSPHKKLAQQFLNFLLSEKVQTIIPRTQWMYPAKQYGELPEEFKKIPSPKKVIRMKPQMVYQMRKKWIDIWLQNS